MVPHQLNTPLRFERHALEKVWGGRALERAFGFALPPQKTIGETWEVVDRAGENSIVCRTPLCEDWVGRSLAQLMESHAGDLLGRGRANSRGRFPVLVKYIDAAQDLSVQVHPDQGAAARLGGGAESKTEAWYVVDAAPGGKLYCGLREGVTRAQYAAVADSPAGVELLLAWDVRVGDCLLVPGGTVHAIGAGVTILEVQENSDTTFRLYDWGRVGLDGRPRATHLGEGLASIRFGESCAGPAQPELSGGGLAGPSGGFRRAPLASSAFFSMELLVPEPGQGGAGARLETEGCWQVLAAVAGEGILVGPNGVEAPIGRGDVWLIPAAAGHVFIRRPEDAGELRLVRATA